MNFFMKKSESISIAILGMQHLGSVYATSFAKMGFAVTGYDVDKKTIYNLRKGVPPIFEPELAETIKKHLSKNLFFCSSSQKILEKKNYVFITYDLPVDQKDRVQTSIIKKTFSDISKYASPDSIIVISSQVPVGTSRKLVNLLKKKNIKTPYVIYFPENLRLGQAFKAFFDADRIILGSDNKVAIKQFIKDFKFSCPSIAMGLESAEMSKHALNSYLATCISFSGELSDLSEKCGANMIDVVKALKSDRRVSPSAPLEPGLGFAGGTLGRDIQSLRKLGKNKGTETTLLNAVYSVNLNRICLLLSKIKLLCPNLTDKTIGILGLTYKPKTDTLRRSMSLSLATLMKDEGCQIKAIDPAITQTIPKFPFIKVCTSFETFFHNLDLIILMTEWPEFKEIYIPEMSKLMRHRQIIDAKNFLDYTTYLDHGFSYIRMGVPN